MQRLRSGASRGGRGSEGGPAQVVKSLLADGVPSELIRADLKSRGYSAARIAQLLKGAAGASAGGSGSRSGAAASLPAARASAGGASSDGVPREVGEDAEAAAAALRFAEDLELASEDLSGEEGDAERDEDDASDDDAARRSDGAGSEEEEEEEYSEGAGPSLSDDADADAGDGTAHGGAAYDDAVLEVLQQEVEAERRCDEVRGAPRFFEVEADLSADDDEGDDEDMFGEGFAEDLGDGAMFSDDEGADGASEASEGDEAAEERAAESPVGGTETPRASPHPEARRLRYFRKRPRRPHDPWSPSAAPAAAAASSGGVRRERPAAGVGANPEVDEEGPARKRPAGLQSAAEDDAGVAGPAVEGEGAAPGPEGPAVHRRPARAPQPPRPSMLCAGGGTAATPCAFARQPSRIGEAARTRKGQTQCVMCSPARLLLAVADPYKKKHISQTLRGFFEAGREDLLEAAFVKIPPEHHEGFWKALERPSRKAGAVEARQAERETANSWDTLLQHRVVVRGPPTEREQSLHQKRTTDDGHRIASKFRAVHEAKDRGDESWRSAVASNFEAWCESGSWVMCQACHRMEKRPVHEADMQAGRRSHTTMQCKHCRYGAGYPTVQLTDIPPELQNLSQEALWALRPLEPWTGTPVWARHGYRVHTDMIRFWWRPVPVRAQLKQLRRREDRRAARAAYALLMASEHSSYRRFIEMQEKFLATNAKVLTGDAGDQKLQLPRRCLEEVGIECAVWPHLYPRTNMCETHVRGSDDRRVKRRNRRARPAASGHCSSSSSDGSGSGSSDPDASVSDGGAEDADAEAAAPLNFAREGRNTAKGSYLAKVLGPVAEYGANYELFQFVYDLWLWSNLGSKKNTVQTPLRLAMAGYSFSPEYWHTRHAALIDVVKQLGLPTMFVTIAPYEWSFPDHAWIQDEMQKQLRSKLHLPVAETLHIAHVLAQSVVGLMTGANLAGKKGNRKSWRSHLLAAKDGSGRRTVLNFFARLEFQDGKRKRYVNMQEAATQFYHGRGTVHVHLLIWLEHIAAVRLEQLVAATSPADNEPLRCLVEGSQRSYSGSGWPQRDAPSAYDEETGLLQLQHLASDRCTEDASGEPYGIRAYLPDILASLQCHVDVQMSDGRGMLLRYVSGYVPKFSDSFTTDWLSDAASDYSVARRVLTDYHPLEPEMVLQLAMQWFPQCFAAGTLQRFVVPVPFHSVLPERVQQYMDCEWRGPSMTLAEYLRKANKKGDPQRYLRQRYASADPVDKAGMTLEAWAARAPARGEVMTAAIYLSRYNDRYYGQWTLMNVPFVDINDLWKEELERVPPHLRYQTLALLHAPDHWTEPDAIRADLELEAFREHHTRNILAMISANHGLIEKYLDGRLDKNDDDEPQHRRDSSGGRPPLSPEQARIKNEIVEAVQAGMQEKTSREDAWQGEPRAGPFGPQRRQRATYAVLGPAGSGKTTAVQTAVEEVHGLGGRVLIVAPTGRLAATYRAKYPHLDVDTIHGAFMVYKPLQETLELMFPFDLVIVEEVGQLSREIFERLMQLWQAAEQIPTVVFVGDFWQLPGVDPTRASDSVYWRSDRVLKRELHTMRRCKCDILRGKLEILRTGKPSVRQLRMIKRGHKAPMRLRRAHDRMGPEPSEDDVWHILGETPATLFLTVSRRACAALNRMALKCLFWDADPLAVLPTDPESNTQNYARSSLVREDPLDMPVYAGARVVLTKNLNKEIGFVNGMGAVILEMDGDNVIVQTDQGRRLAVHPWTSEARVAHFPMRVGYASTLHKVQGATLPHVTLWLDVANMPAAAYVALSRVEYDANWRFVGDPGVHHFTPARF